MQAEQIADGVAAAVSHPVTVQVINQGAGIWGNVATGAITAVAAIGAVMLTHCFTLHRERQGAKNKLEKEQHFIATELVFLLEQFAEGCARVASDTGKDNQGVQPEKEPTVNYPLLNLTDVSGDWRVLPRLSMYRIRELPVLQNEAQRTIASVREHSDPPNHSDYFRERHYQFARIGVKAVILAIRLRRFVGLPETRLRDTQWSAYNVLWKKWRDESNRRIVLKRLEKQELAVFEIMNSQRKAVQGAELTESNKP